MNTASVSERRCAASDNAAQLDQQADFCSKFSFSLPLKPYVEDELGSGTVELLRRLKETIDPQNIMVRSRSSPPSPARSRTDALHALLITQNPGKLIPERKA